MPRFNREEKSLIVIQALIYFASALANVFVNIFFFSRSDLKTTVLYTLIALIFLLIFYTLSGRSLKKVSAGFLIKLGIMAWAVFYFLMFYLRSESIHYVIWLGALNGFAGGNFWAGFNLSQYINTNKDKRVEYFGSSVGVVSFLQAMAPFIGGAIINIAYFRQWFGQDANYGALFLLVSLIFLTAFFVVRRLPIHNISLFSYKDVIYHQRSKQWKLILSQWTLFGLFDSSFGVVGGIMYYLILKKELLVGSAQTAGLLLGAAGSIISIILLRKKAGYYWVGALGFSAGLAGFALFQNLFGLVFYVIVGGITTPFLTNWLAVVLLRAIDKVEKPWQEKYQFLLEKDMCLGTARVLSMSFLFCFIQFGNQVTFARYWLYFVPFVPLFIGMLLWRYQQSEK